MKERVVSGIVIAVLLVAFGVVGGPALGVVLCICAVLGYMEMARAVGAADPVSNESNAADPAPSKAPAKEIRGGDTDPTAPVAAGKANALTWIGAAATVLYYIALIAGPYQHLLKNVFSYQNALTAGFIIAVFVLTMAVYVLTFPRYRAEQAEGAIFSFLYVPVLMAFIYRTRMLHNGIFSFALIFLCSWLCDTCAWFFGRLFGQHKMAPVLSPKKTVEGGIGGVAGSVVLCGALAVIAARLLHESQHIAEFMIIGFFGSLISMVGDLAASAIKRNHEIKDYSHLIPGHGGIMDRFDSAIFTAPVIYYLCVMLLRF